MSLFNEKDDSLCASLKFKDFAQAFSFMQEVAVVAERLNHHPEWTNVWNQVDITLRTHSAGNKVTAKDVDLAKQIETIFNKY